MIGGIGAADVVEGYGARQTWRHRLVALRRLDWKLITAVVALSVLSALLVRSATFAELAEQGRDPNGFVKRHLLNLALGLILGGVVAMLDYRLLRAYAPIVYGLACVGLVAVLSPLGETINGSHSWIVLGGGFQVQPSEFAKVGLVVLLAMLLAEPRDGEPRDTDSGPGGRDIVLALALAGGPAVLVLAQPDLGTTMVFGAVVMGMLAVAGVRKRWLAGLAGAAVLAAFAVWFFGLLKPYQIARFTAFIDPEADPRGAGYNAQQARIAVGSGGLTGKGLFEGEQTGGHFVPEQQTDFIFTVAGEELGFVGAGLIIVLLGIIMWRACTIARETPELYGTIVAAGIVAWFAFQCFENIGMTLGIMPVTGLPLPFVSYGGSAMFAVWVAVGLLQSIKVQRPMSA